MLRGYEHMSRRASSIEVRPSVPSLYSTFTGVLSIALGRYTLHCPSCSVSSRHILLISLWQFPNSVFSLLPPAFLSFSLLALSTGPLEYVNRFLLSVMTRPHSSCGRFCAITAETCCNSSPDPSAMRTKARCPLPSSSSYLSELPAHTCRHSPRRPSQALFVVH